MKVNVSRRSILTIVCAIVAAVFVLLAVWNRSQQEIEPSESAAYGAAPAEPAVEPQVSAEAQEDTAADAEGMDPAKRIVHVPDTRSAPAGQDHDETEEVTGVNVAGIAALSVEKALDGDLRSAWDLTNLMKVCSSLAPRDEEGLQREIQRYNEEAARIAERGNPLPAEGRIKSGREFGSGLVEIKVFPTEAQNRRHLTEWYRGCREVSVLLNEKTREELAALARNGHVVARYLYAMWRPQLGSDEDALERRMRWQMNAVEFSYANLEEGELAGLLAFSQSYSEAIFTGTDLGLSLSMAKAALECGFESEAISWRMEHLRSRPDSDLLWRIAGIDPDEFDALVAEFSSRCR